MQQGGGDSIHPRLRFAYGTLGGFLAGQALSNFSDADADTESMEFGGAIGSTGGQRIPQVRYTVAGPYGSAFSVSAENPWTSVMTPGGAQSSDFAESGTGTSTTPPEGVIGAICNGIPAPARAEHKPTRRQPKPRALRSLPTGRSPGGMSTLPVSFAFKPSMMAGLSMKPSRGFGGHIAGDVHPGWWGYNKDDFLWSFVVGNAIGGYASGGLATFFPMATNFTVTTQCATPTATCKGGMAASNVLFSPVFAFSTNGGYQHWWTPNLRSTIAAGYGQQDVNAQLIGPSSAISTNKILWNAFVNLVWNPVAFVTTGVEYMYGHRTVVANLQGHEHVMIYKFRVAF